MGDSIDDDGVVILNAKLPADVVVMLGLGEYEDGASAGFQRSGEVIVSDYLRTKDDALILVVVEEDRRAGSNAPLSSGSASGSVTPSPDGPASMRKKFLASIQLDEDYVQMLLEEGIRTHRDLHIKEILGSELLESIKDALRRGASPLLNSSSSYQR
ncbi:hypothetical protein BJV78DRAFT_1284718 [Lactifluus subvellereus]|nr:hypothetical protein BJV78DRAFT_1284718 [Lactifluus subvellereus]